MAGRPTKQGLEYFPLDVDFFNDEKIEFVSARFGAKGEIIAIRLLCKIYRIGYYTEWNEDESTLLAKRAGEGITPALVSDVVKELVKRGFFDEIILNRFGILTSKGIQKRYVSATGERKEVEINRDIWMINIPKNAGFLISQPINSISPPINPVKPPDNPQSKVEKSKEEKDSVARNRATQSGFNDYFLKRKELFKTALSPYVEMYGRDMLNAFFSYWTEPNKSGTKMRFELERTWEISRRLNTWASREKINGKQPDRQYTYTEMLVVMAKEGIPMSHFSPDGLRTNLWKRVK